MNSLLLGSLRAALAAVIFTLSGNAYAEEGWLVSFEKAKQQAAKEGKPILMEFADQIGALLQKPCIRMF